MSQFENEIKGLVQLASGTCSLSTNVNEAFIQSGCLSTVSGLRSYRVERMGDFIMETRLTISRLTEGSNAGKNKTWHQV